MECNEMSCFVMRPSARRPFPPAPPGAKPVAPHCRRQGRNRRPGRPTVDRRPVCRDRIQHPASASHFVPLRFVLSAAAPNAANIADGGVDAAAAPNAANRVRPAALTPPPAPLRGGPCFARIARERGRPLAPARFARLIARARPCARGGRRTHPSPLLPRGLFSHRHNPKRPPDNRLLPLHLVGGDADFNPHSAFFPIS